MIDPSQYKITVFDTLDKTKATHGRVVDLDFDIIKKTIWSPIIFEDNRRLKNNFIKSDFFVADVDHSLCIEEACKRLDKFNIAYYLCSTRNHQMLKDDKYPPCDRYRVLVFMDKPITSLLELELCFNHMSLIFSNTLDSKAKLGSQFFFPCNGIVEYDETDGDPFKFDTSKGMLMNKTLKFIAEGAEDRGHHDALVSACFDFKAQGFSKEFFIDLVSFLEDDYLDKDGLATINNCFKSEVRLSKNIIPQSELDKKYPSKHNNFINQKGDKKYPDYYELAQYVREELLIKCSSSFITKYENNYWGKIQDLKLKQILSDLTSKQFTPQQIKTAFETIKFECYDEQNQFPPEGFINLKNGVLNTNTKELLPHDPKYNFSYCLPHIYDPYAKCPIFYEFLKEITKQKETLVHTLRDFMGYTIAGGYPWLHKSLCLYGTGRNGKSIFLETFAYLLGEKNYSDISLKKIDREFSVVRLWGKLANIVEESPTDKIDSESFKNLVSGGTVNAAYKGKDEFSFANTARFLFSCNKLPKLHDTSVGANERIIFVPFDRYFKEEERDYTIRERVKKEISGILNFALDGLDAVRKNNSITKGIDSKNVEHEYRIESDSVYEFFHTDLQKYISKDGYGFTSCEKLHEYYLDFCKTRGIYAVSQHALTGRMNNILIELENDADDNKIKYSNYPGRGYHGISIRN